MSVAIRLNGEIIGYARQSTSGDQTMVHACVAGGSLRDKIGKFFDSKEEARAWLVERHEKSKISDDEGDV